MQTTQRVHKSCCQLKVRRPRLTGKPTTPGVLTVQCLMLSKPKHPHCHKSCKVSNFVPMHKIDLKFLMYIIEVVVIAAANLSARKCAPGVHLSTNVGHQGSMMIPLVPVIVSQNAYILYIRAPRFGDPVQGTAACRYERQAALSALCYPTSRKRGLILEVKCKMMSASRKRLVFLE